MPHAENRQRGLNDATYGIGRRRLLTDSMGNMPINKGTTRPRSP